MRNRRIAYGSLAVIVLAIGAADWFVLTSGPALSAIAAREVDGLFGNRLEHGEVTASLDGLVVVHRVGLNLDGKTRVLSADRVEIRLARRSGTYVPESVTLIEPRLTLNHALLTQLTPSDRPLRETFPHDLPRLRCSGGQLEVIHPDLHWSAPQTFAIEELALAPVGGTRYLVAGALRSGLLGRWDVTGELDVDKGSVRLALATEKVDIGPDVRAIFSEDVRAQWDRYRSEGPAAVRVRIDAKPKEPEDVRMTVEPLGMRFCYAGFPYAWEDARGEIDFLSDRVVVKALSARRGDTRLRFSGSAGGYGPEADFTFRLEIDSMPLDKNLRAALGDKAGKDYDKLRPSGIVDVRGLITREYGVGKPVREVLDVGFRDAGFQYSDFPYEVAGANGELHIDLPRVEVKRLAGRHGDGIVELDGVIDDTLDLRIRGWGIPLDNALGKAIASKEWEEYSPKGSVDVDWRLTQAKGEARVHRGTVTAARDCSVTYRAEDAKGSLQISNVTGTVSYGPEGVHLDHLSGKIDVNAGKVAIAETPERYELTLGGVRVDRRFRDAMPKSVSKLLDRLNFSGSVSGTVDLNRKQGWGLQLRFSDAGLDAGIPIEKADGFLSLSSGTLKDDQISGTGSLLLFNATVMNRKVRNLIAGFNMNGSRLDFTEIQAEAYGGSVRGRLSIDMETTEIGGGEFTVDQMDLRDYVRDSEDFPNRVLAGQVSLKMNNLAGKGNDLASLKGDGTLTIRDGELFEVPAIVNILSPFSSTKKFDAGKVVFTIKDCKFEISDLGFTSKGGGSVAGQGELTFSGRYDLNLKITPRPLLGFEFFFFDIPAIILGEFMQKHVVGDLESAKPEKEE